MISLKASKFLVECDEDYNHHIFVRTPHGYDEITNGDYNKDELINDLVYVVSELVKERDKKQYPIIDKIRAEIKGKIEQEEFARSVFRHEEKDTAKAEQCTGSIMAYNNVIKLIDKYKAESEPQESE